MEIERTRDVVADFLKHRLNVRGFTWDNDGRQSNITPTPVQLAMRRLGDEFEERFRVRFQDITQKLDFSEDNAFETFSAIQHEIFHDGANWGRIVALFSFSGHFAEHCFQRNMPALVNSIVEWVADYIDINLHEWMSSQNYWQGFMAFQSLGAEASRDSQWPSLKTVCSYAAAGLGFLTLGAFLTQRS